LTNKLAWNEPKRQHYTEGHWTLGVTSHSATVLYNDKNYKHKAKLLTQEMSAEMFDLTHIMPQN